MPDVPTLPIIWFSFIIAPPEKKISRKIAIERMVTASVVYDNKLAKPLEPFGEDDLAGIDGPGICGSICLDMNAVSEYRVSN